MARYKAILLILSLIIFAGYLRFVNLGYSEFQDDEKKAMIKPGLYGSTIEFLLNQRKGPMQFAVTSAVLAFNNDRQNELGLRIPFTIASLIAVPIFFLIIKELTKSNVASYIGTLIFMSNGFIVGFSRIAQYQNLNILFSLLALWCFIKLSNASKHFLPYALSGTTALALSLLSHWDAIFFVVPIVYFFVVFLRNAKVDKHMRQKVLLASLIFGLVLTLPFLIPYVKTQLYSESNKAYFEKRMGVSTYSLRNHKSIFELYNPFITLYLLGALSIFSFVKIKKSYIFVLWFIVNFLFIKLLMQKPGTHIYNYIIPGIFLATLGFHFTYEFIKWKPLKGVLFAAVFGASAFLYWQSYVLFVDHTKEYPWESKTVLKTKNFSLVAPVFDSKEVLTFGFPHYRAWKKVAEIINADSPECKYITNEGKEISQIYLPDNFGTPPKPKCYYVAEITRPFIMRGNNAVFAEKSNKKPVFVYEKNGEKLLKLYKIR